MDSIEIRLLATRQQLNLSLDDMENRLNDFGFNLTGKQIERFEQGEEEVTATYLQILVNYFNINPAWLIGTEKTIFNTREPDVFIPFFNREECSSYTALEEAQKHPTKFVAFTKSQVESMLSTNE